MARARATTASERLSRWRVEAAWGAVLVLPFTRATPATLLGGLPLVVLGLAMRVWARGYLEREVYLAQAGPYAWLRHPLYAGSLLVGVGFAVMCGVPPLIPLFLVLFAIGYVPKIRREEAFLRRKYGPAHERYVAAVPPILPRLRARGAASVHSDQRFSWRRVIRKGEWRTWLGTAAGMVALAVRAGLRARGW